MTLRGAVALALLLLAGCGFQLRGWDLQTTVDTVSVDARARHFLTQPLRDALETAGVDTGAGASSEATIRLLDQRTDRRNASVGAGARAAEIETTLAVQFAIDHDGQEVLAPRWIEGTRVLSIDRTNIVGSNEEQVLLEEEIKNDLVGQIMRTLNVVLTPDAA